MLQGQRLHETGYQIQDNLCIMPIQIVLSLIKRESLTLFPWKQSYKSVKLLNGKVTRLYVMADTINHIMTPARIIYQ